MGPRFSLNSPCLNCEPIQSQTTCTCFESYTHNYLPYPKNIFTPPAWQSYLPRQGHPWPHRPHAWGTGSTPLLSYTSPTAFPCSGKVVNPGEETLPDSNCLELNTIHLICPQISEHETVYNPLILKEYRLEPYDRRGNKNPQRRIEWSNRSTIEQTQNEERWYLRAAICLVYNLKWHQNIRLHIMYLRSELGDLITPVFYLCNFNDLQLLPDCSVFHLPTLLRELFFFLNQPLVIDFQSIESPDRYCLACWHYSL